MNYTAQLLFLAALHCSILAEASTVVVDFGVKEEVIDLSNPGTTYSENGFVFTGGMGPAFIDTSPPFRDLLLNAGPHSMPRQSSQVLIEGTTLFDLIQFDVTLVDTGLDSLAFSIVASNGAERLITPADEGTTISFSSEWNRIANLRIISTHDGVGTEGGGLRLDNFWFEPVPEPSGPVLSMVAMMTWMLQRRRAWK